MIIIRTNVSTVFIMDVHREHYPKQFSLSPQLYNVPIHEDDVRVQRRSKRLGKWPFKEFLDYKCLLERSQIVVLFHKPQDKPDKNVLIKIQSVAFLNNFRLLLG